MTKILTPIAEITFNDQESILHIKVSENAEMNLKNTQIHYEKINGLLLGKKYLALVDSSNYFSIDKEAWEYASLKEVSANRIAAAHYNSTFSNKLTTNFFTANYQVSMPVQIFVTKEEALEWLKSHSHHLIAGN